MPEIVFKFTVSVFIIFLTFIRCYDARQLRALEGKTWPRRYEPKEHRESVLEGERTVLDFSYPCNSTEVTLQRSYDDPFYNSGNPGATSSGNKIVTNPKNGGNCSLHLVIDPVSRNDTDWYILMTNDNTVENILRLDVDYPPGKASCQPNSHIHLEWVRLQCEAQVGSLPGQIACYQNNIGLPPLTLPQENAENISQVILARLSDEVYCCSSFFGQTMDICACKDWGWNFTDNRPLTSIHPCASASTTQIPSDADVDITSIPISNFTTTLTQPPLIQRGSHKWVLITACIYMTILLLTTFIFGVCTLKYKHEAQQLKISSESVTAHFNREQEQVNLCNNI